MENKPDKAHILEINETGDDKLLSVNKLREKYIEYVKSHYIKSPHLFVKNKDTKWKIEITTQVIKEWRQKSRTRPRIMSILLLEEMIKTAIMGIPASPFGCTDLNITVSGYRLFIISRKFTGLSTSIDDPFLTNLALLLRSRFGDRHLFSVIIDPPVRVACLTTLEWSGSW